MKLRTLFMSMLWYENAPPSVVFCWYVSIVRLSFTSTSYTMTIARSIANGSSICSRKSACNSAVKYLSVVQSNGIQIFRIKIRVQIICLIMIENSCWNFPTQYYLFSNAECLHSKIWFEVSCKSLSAMDKMILAPSHFLVLTGNLGKNMFEEYVTQITWYTCHLLQLVSLDLLPTCTSHLVKT